MSDRRTGTIARLPKELKDKVCLMLRDGCEYRAVIDLLAQQGIECNDQNVSNWMKFGGMDEWIKEHQRLEDMRAKREFALKIVQENEGSLIHEAGMQVAASQIYEVLNDFDVESLKEKLKGDPENFSRLVNAMSKLSDSGLKYERYKAEVKAAKDRALTELGKARAKGGITPETLEKIEHELKLL